MSEYNLTLCDLCAPGKIPALNRGYALVDPEYAITKLGWVEQDVGHVCPVCIKEQGDRAARDAAEEAHSENLIMFTLEQGLAEAEAQVRAVIELHKEEASYEHWVERVRAQYEEKRASLRKSYGQPI